ncbi:MAG TPA: NAD-dependent deacylase [Bacteroidota bacterium]|nr:NAD-dependent deacylase [Bacteroidota bacterium]
MLAIFSKRLLEKLESTERIVVFTGAGISAESGVPTFRGAEGLWNKFKPEELANFDAFLQNPELVWEWYKYRKTVMKTVEPNPGHRAIAEMERIFPSAIVVTQNIDNLHRRAGSSHVFELHGNIDRNYCIDCGQPHSNDEIFAQERAPRCLKCGGMVRPDVVWFGEMLPVDVWEESVKAVESAEIFLSVGTSGVVYPAASLPSMARRAGAFTVEINIEPTDLSGSFSECIPGKAGDILPQLLPLCPQRSQ